MIRCLNSSFTDKKTNIKLNLKEKTKQFVSCLQLEKAKHENSSASVQCVRFNLNLSGNVMEKPKRGLNHRKELNEFKLKVVIGLYN